MLIAIAISLTGHFLIDDPYAELYETPAKLA